MTRDTIARLEAKFEGSQQNLAGLRTELLELAHNLISFSGEVRQEVADSRAQVSAKIEALADGMPSTPLADATTTTFSPAHPARIDRGASPKPPDPTPINEAMLDAGEVPVQLSTVDVATGKASVKAFAAVSSDDRVARVAGNEIIVEISSRRYSDSPMVLQGPGAGLKITAAGIFADLLRLSRSLVEWNLPSMRSSA